jgi:site-specific recombinase XerD/ribosomal protein L40E
MDIHNYEQKYQSVIRRVEKAPISERNKELILAMKDALVLQNISKPRLMKYMEVLKMSAQKLGKDLDKVTEQDLKKFVAEIQQSTYSPWTKQTYKVLLRRFYKWHYGTKEYPALVSWITIGMHRSERRLPSEGDLLVENDIEKFISTANHPRDKAIIAVLWESGARISEIGNPLIKHIAFDKHGILLTVRGKTGSRKIRLIWSVPYVSTWLNNHPFRDDPEAPLWVNIGNVRHQEAMSYPNIRMLIIRTAQEAGIKKRVNPHTFRHSRATFMAKHLTEFQMNQYFGWIQGSDMPSTYVHMSGKAVDEALLRMNGVAIEINKAETRLLPRICPRCDTINSQDSRHCNKCGGVLDLRFAMEQEDIRKKEVEERSTTDTMMNRLLQDKEVQEFLMSKLQSFGTKNI